MYAHKGKSVSSVNFPSLCAQPASEGTAVPFVHGSGEAATGEARACGAQKAEAGRVPGEGGHILTFVRLSHPSTSLFQLSFLLFFLTFA